MSQKETEQRLLELVEQRREQECRQLQERAREEARELLRNAYRKARAQLHENAESERERARIRVGAARAELETLRRQRTQQLGSVLLEAAAERLPRQLAERWADPETRAAWISAALEQALARLPDGPWHIRYPAGLEEAECESLGRAAIERLSQAPELVADSGVGTGVIFDCAGVTLDVSGRGLLDDRDAIEARLLALMNPAQLGETIG